MENLKMISIATFIIGIAGLTFYLTPKPKKIEIKSNNKISKIGPFEGKEEESLEGMDFLSKLKQKIKAPRPPLLGFEWYYNSLINVFTMIPNEWIVDDKKDGNPCFDSIPSERGEVGTYPRFSLFGMMVDKKGVTIENVAQGLSKSLEQTGRKIQKDWTNSQIETQRNSIYVTKDLLYTSSVTTCLTELIYNPITETIYVVQFEAPTEQWEDLFVRIGSNMIGSVEPQLIR